MYMTTNHHECWSFVYIMDQASFIHGDLFTATYRLRGFQLTRNTQKIS